MDQLTENDLSQHIVTFGFDVYPPIGVSDERTRLNMFYEQAREQWNTLFEDLATGDREFRISKTFRRHPGIQGPSTQITTFRLTERGPVFVFPLRLDETGGATGLEDGMIDTFNEIRGLFSQACPNRSIMRLGMVRDLVFDTGQTRCTNLVADQSSFAKADLAGGRIALLYCDEMYNHNLVLEPVSRAKLTRLGVGAVVNEPTGYGVHVQLDVNNRDVKGPLQESDIQGVLDRATGLWPEILLEFIAGFAKRRPA